MLRASARSDTKKKSLVITEQRSFLMYSWLPIRTSVKIIISRTVTFIYLLKIWQFVCLLYHTHQSGIWVALSSGIFFLEDIVNYVICLFYTTESSFLFPLRINIFLWLLPVNTSVCMDTSAYIEVLLKAEKKIMDLCLYKWHFVGSMCMRPICVNMCQKSVLYILLL